MPKGVLLFNLGGPETLADVRPFLYNLFSDPEIIRIKNDVLRKLIARIIVQLRHRKSAALYRRIGGGSPLRRITEEQGAALRNRLLARGCAAEVYVGMRCWKPTIDDAVDRILKDGISDLVLLPLFPQFSVTTTGSCLKRFAELDRRLGISGRMRIATVREWFAEPLYLQAMSELIREALERFPAEERGKVWLLYSAHSIPARYVEEGDPYLDQTKKTVDLINSALRVPTGSKLSSAFDAERRHRLAFQSKIGPVRWLRPSTKEVLEELGRQRASVLTAPISFVSDHLETLEEIDNEYRRLALESGVRAFHRAASPNLHPTFIEALAEVATKAFSGVER